jgi:hypothetical protein
MIPRTPVSISIDDDNPLWSEDVTRSVAATLAGIRETITSLTGVDSSIVGMINLRLANIPHFAENILNPGVEMTGTISLGYIRSFSPEIGRKQAEGIIYHQAATAVFGQCQWPEWLKDGMAEWVRLRAGLPCTHWDQRPGVHWTARDGAVSYFWDYFNDATNSNMPQFLKLVEMGEDIDACCYSLANDSLKDIWTKYQRSLIFEDGPHQPPKMKFEDEGNSEVFSRCIPDPIGLLDTAYATAISLLYPDSKFPIRRVQHVTLRLCAKMEGVANTSGGIISLAMPYVNKVASRNSVDKTTYEITGVIIHEMVHAVQFNGGGNTPGGLIEGIADYVRLRAQFAPPHWRITRGGKWDSGYERTGYFLDWAQKRHPGFVEECNTAMALEWDEEWCRRHCQSSWEELWSIYQEGIKHTQVDAHPSLPTHGVKPNS